MTNNTRIERNRQAGTQRTVRWMRVGRYVVTGILAGGGLFACSASGTDVAPRTDDAGSGNARDSGTGNAQDSGSADVQDGAAPDAGTTPCAAGFYDHDGKASTACVPWTDCSPGQYVKEDGSPTSDRKCAACASGTFTTATNASACADWATCSAGTYVTNTPSVTLDRTCSPCAADHYTAGANESQCLPIGVCPAGTEQKAAGTSTSATVCEACAAGNYCAGGTAAAGTCGSSEWDDDANSATVCVARTSCIAGQYVSDDGSATTDRACATCPNDTFSATSNAPSCTSWMNCSAGTHVSSPGSATADRACAPCATGYTATGNESSCTPWTNCTSPGQYVSSAGTATANRVCASCASGTYSTQENALACAPPTTAVAFTSTGGLDADSNDSVGFRFTVGAADINVVQLGVWDENGDGFAISHPVGIYRVSDQALITSTTVPAGTNATLDSGFRYVEISPVVLTANTAYVVMSYRATGADRVLVSVGGQTTASAITYNMGVYRNSAGGLTYPQFDYAPASVFGPNFKFF